MWVDTVVISGYFQSYSVRFSHIVNSSLTAISHVFYVIILSIFVLAFVILFLIIYRLQYEGMPNAWGRVSQVQKMGYRRYIVVHAWLGKGDRSGMPADAQVSWHDFAVHVQRLFLPKWRSRWLWHHLMMSLTSFLHNLREVIKDSVHEPSRFIHSFVSACWSSDLFPIGSSGKPQTLWLSYLSASWGVGL